MKKFFCLLLTILLLTTAVGCIPADNTDNACDKCGDSGVKAWVMNFDENGNIITEGGTELCVKCAHKKGWALEFKEID